MPEMDGAETLRELARRSPGLPVIMVTVNEDVETTSHLLQLGAADYVPKPFNLEYLEQAINIQLSVARG
jgi:DNA-binding response OmpR family regulator